MTPEPMTPEEMTNEGNRLIAEAKDKIRAEKAELARRVREEYARSIEAHKDTVSENIGIPRNEWFERAYDIAKGQDGNLTNMGYLMDELSTLYHLARKQP
jgi:hypothetical protein